MINTKANLQHEEAHINHMFMGYLGQDIIIFV